MCNSAARQYLQEKAAVKIKKYNEEKNFSIFLNAKYITLIH